MMHLKSILYQAATLVLAVLLLTGPVRQAAAWGPHPQITRAAIKVLPDLPRWKAALGAITWLPWPTTAGCRTSAAWTWGPIMPTITC